MTNIRKDADKPDDHEYLTFNIDPVTGDTKQRYEPIPWQEATTSTDWRRQMKYSKIRIKDLY